MKSKKEKEKSKNEGNGRRVIIVRMSEVEIKEFHEGQECEYYPKIKRLNQHWEKFVGKGKRCVIVSMLGREEVIIELKDTGEMIVCKTTDLFSLDQTL